MSNQFIRAARELPLSYDPIGLAKQNPDGFKVDEEDTIIGSGEAAFRRATQALVAWTHFAVGWVELFPERRLQSRQGPTSLCWRGTSGSGR